MNASEIGQNVIASHWKCCSEYEFSITDINVNQLLVFSSQSTAITTTTTTNPH